MISLSMRSSASRWTSKDVDLSRVIASLLIVALLFGALPVAFAGSDMAPDCATSSTTSSDGDCCGDNALMADCNAACVMNFAAVLAANDTAPSPAVTCRPEVPCIAPVLSLTAPPDTAPPKAFSA
jgi:hypothetical protein